MQDKDDPYRIAHERVCASLTHDDEGHGSITTDAEVPLVPVKNEGKWGRTIRVFDWLECDSMGIELDGRTVDSVRRCLQSAVRSAGRDGSETGDLYVTTNSDYVKPVSAVALMMIGD